MRHWRLLCFLGLFLFGTAEAALRIDGSMPEQDLNACATLQEDPGGMLGIAEMLAPVQAGRFVPAKTAAILHLGVSRSAWWLRCQVNLAGAKGFIEAGYPNLDHVEIYFVREGQVLASAQAGDAIPHHGERSDSRRFVFPVPDVRGDLSLYVRVQSSGPVTIPLRWLSKNELERETRIDWAVLAAYAGVLFALSLYNLFLYFAVRARSFLYYVLSTVAYGFALACVLGYAAAYLWPQVPQWNNPAPVIAMEISSIFGIFFTCSFFATARRMPRVHRWLMGASLVLLLAIGIAPMATEASGYLYTLVGNAVFVILLIVIVRGLRERWPGTLPYAVAMALQVAVATSQGLQGIGMISSSLWNAYSLQLGAAGVAMFFALGMAVRLNAIKQAKERAQAEVLLGKEMLVVSLRQNEYQLEIRVEERTRELAAVNAALRERERQLEEMAHRDMLTGVASRALFEDRLLQAMARSVRGQRLMALLLIDLDGFKVVNDTHGHDAGDAVLVELCRRFEASIRSIDTLGRLGGDEFVIIIEDQTVVEDAARVASKILREAALPVMHGGVQLQVGASIGIAYCPRDASEIGELLKAADRAMYEAKRAGRGCWRAASV